MSIISHLKNSFFSSSVFKVILLRKFITSRKSFLWREKYITCLKTSSFQSDLITDSWPLTWKSHESAGSWVEVETRGQSSAGPPAESSSSCQTAPVTLESTRERINECKRSYRCKQHYDWGKRSSKHQRCPHFTHQSRSGKGWASPPSCQKNNSPENERVYLEVLWNPQPVKHVLREQV